MGGPFLSFALQHLGAFFGGQKWPPKSGQTKARARRAAAVTFFSTFYCILVRRLAFARGRLNRLCLRGNVFQKTGQNALGSFFGHFLAIFSPTKAINIWVLGQRFRSS